MLSMLWLYNQESRKVGLTSQQAQLLCVAARREAGLSEMAEVLHCDPSNISRLLDRVATRGLAYRGAAKRDGRVSVVKLTDDGEELVQQVEADLEARLNRLVEGWPPDRREAIGRALGELVETIRQDMAAEERDAEEPEEPKAVPAAARRPATPSRAGTQRRRANARVR